MIKKIVLIFIIIVLFIGSCTISKSPVNSIKMSMFKPGEKNIYKKTIINDTALIKKILNSIDKDNVPTTRGQINGYDILYEMEMIDKENNCIQKYEYYTLSSKGNRITKLSCPNSFPISVYTNDSLLFLLEKCFKKIN